MNSTTLLTQPLRVEHHELFPHIELLRVVADSVGAVPADSLREGLDDVHSFLTNHLLPHAHAEEVALYPVVAQFMGAPEATATMRRDHTEVERLTSELGALRSQLTVSGSLSEGQLFALRRVLYGLYTLVRVHFAKEEEIYLPILDEFLTPEGAAELFEAMEKAAHG